MMVNRSGLPTISVKKNALYGLIPSQYCASFPFINLKYITSWCLTCWTCDRQIYLKMCHATSIDFLATLLIWSHVKLNFHWNCLTDFCLFYTRQIERTKKVELCGDSWWWVSDYLAEWLKEINLTNTIWHYILLYDNHIFIKV